MRELLAWHVTVVQAYDWMYRHAELLPPTDEFADALGRHVSLPTVQALAGLPGKYRRAEISALTKPEDAFARSDVTKMSPELFDRWYCTPYVSSISYQIQQAIPGSEAKPVYRVAATEGKILDRVELLMGILAAAALATAALAVASMMLATVLERRAEIGIFKSLGSTNARVAALFLLEAGTVGFAGGAAGYLMGSLLARQLARQVFGTAASFHWVFLPAALARKIPARREAGAWPQARHARRMILLAGCVQPSMAPSINAAAARSWSAPCMPGIAYWTAVRGPARPRLFSSP